MVIYSNQNNNSDVIATLQQYEGTGLWVRCWVDELEDEDFGDIGGYGYIKVLKINRNSCRAKFLPISDEAWYDVFDSEDILDYIIKRTYFIPYTDIDFNKDNGFGAKTYSNNEIRKIIEAEGE